MVVFLISVVVGWGRAYEGYEQTGSMKKQLILLISAVRTLMRSKAKVTYLLTNSSSIDHHQPDSYRI